MDGGSASRSAAQKSPPKQHAHPSIALAVARPDAAVVGDQRGADFDLYLQGGKRGVDILFSSTFLLFIGSWLLPLIAVLIRLDSRGPVLFRQERVGLGGKNFVCLKFRSMQHDPEADFVQATAGDSRITRVGRFLRKTNLDELPQFINVLRGEMSVVGPRPHVPELDADFAHKIPGYKKRIAVRPGVTGLAQVSGARGETRSVQEMALRVRLDQTYLRRCSLLADLNIIARTVVCVLRGDEKAC